jgi:hypothetical protein
MTCIIDDFFPSRLDQIIDRSMPLPNLASRLRWQEIETSIDYLFGQKVCTVLALGNVNLFDAYRFRHQMTQVFVLYGANFKLATKKGAVGRFLRFFQVQTLRSSCLPVFDGCCPRDRLECTIWH